MGKREPFLFMIGSVVAYIGTLHWIRASHYDVLDKLTNYSTPSRRERYRMHYVGLGQSCSPWYN